MARSNKQAADYEWMKSFRQILFVKRAGKVVILGKLEWWAIIERNFRIIAALAHSNCLIKDAHVGKLCIEMSCSCNNLHLACKNTNCIIYAVFLRSSWRRRLNTFAITHRCSWRFTFTCALNQQGPARSDHLLCTQNCSLFKLDDIHWMFWAFAICHRQGENQTKVLPRFDCCFRDWSANVEKRSSRVEKKKKANDETNECNELNGSARGLPYTHIDGLENQSMNPFC